MDPSTPSKVKSGTITSIPLESGLTGTLKPSVSAWFSNAGWTPDGNNSKAIELYPYKLIQVSLNHDINPNSNTRTVFWKEDLAFSLPISPQQLNISTPFSIITTPTLDGLVEEHNSIRFKEIEIAGTMGVFPANRAMESWKSTLGTLRLFEPTGVLDNAESLTASVPLLQFIRLAAESMVEPAEAKNSGYSNLHKLRVFLETYAENKKTNKNLRLVFASYKDNLFYFVTPTNFVVRRSANSPLEYEYTLSLRAWGTYNPEQGPDEYVRGETGNLAALALVTAASISPALAAYTTASTFSVEKTKGLYKDYFDKLGSDLDKLLNNKPPQEITQEEVQEASDTTAKASEALTNTIGLVSPPAFTSGSEVLPLPSSSQQGAPTTEQLEGVFALNNLKISLDHLKASLMAQAPVQANPLDYVAGLASKSGIAFQTSVSKFPAPFPANSTLEHIAAKYLGNPNRWLEIATLNDLRSPYVDNTGFSTPLMYDGYQNKVVIQGDDLDIGKYVIISSSTQPRKTYGVVSFIKNANYYEVTLDNDFNKPIKNTTTLDDLSRYKKSDNATLQYYTPNTVRAGQIIYIPSDEPSNVNGFNTSQIPSLRQYEEEIRVSGVDLLLKNNSDRVTQDLVIESNDVPLSTGLTNLNQSLILILSTFKGSILQHPDFGIPNVLGSSNADINYQDFEQAIRTAILSDRSFSNVEFITSSLNKGVLTVTVGVRVAQINKVLPVAFDVNLRGA